MVLSIFSSHCFDFYLKAMGRENSDCMWGDLCLTEEEFSAHFA